MLHFGTHGGCRDGTNPVQLLVFIIMVAFLIPILTGCAQLGNVVGLGDSGKLPVKVSTVQSVPATGMNMVPSTNVDFVPAMAARAEIDLGGLPTPVKMKGTVPGWVLINVEPSAAQPPPQ